MSNWLSQRTWLFVVLAGLWLLSGRPLHSQQDIIQTGTGLGVERTRLAVSSFRASADTISLRTVFDDVLWNDLDYAGIFDLVSRSFYPLALPTRPEDLKPEEWTRSPVNAHMVVLGNTYMAGNQFVIEGWLVDPRNATQPVVLGKRYVEEPTDQAARQAAHKFANEIIYRLGGGIPGIAESRIAFVRRMGPQVKEIWMMDYDGANQEQITQLKTLSLTPAISVDGTQIAFTSYKDSNPNIVIFSLLTRKQIATLDRRGLNTTPTWSADGTRLAFTSSVTGDPEIYVADARGRNYKRLTVARGVDISPSWNPKTGAQIAFVSDRSGHPQIYLMDNEGANVTQLVSGGSQALDPAWSPNGRLLAFTWDRDGEYNIYLLDVATREFVQMTRAKGRNEHPSWSPDNRHIVFQSNRSGSTQIWTMLADGSKPRQLTFQGDNTEPVWSSR
ncbi:MAG: Tol-Pal system beta propeller repeat protein TolB [Acidobacteria bacterium RIFCSPLOWO2_02_FULL_59_13]|nr:MAG: Tol-Pal system beta propeller repeat protein TolB [Acidobacteria bacterium RIFCSPLOWO2_02_FULL_59_13]